jgi:NDP-sugar pyrophosphorylase family protein
MRIVIPMAGQSKRFFDRGYALPKFFLPLGEKKMIERVVDLFDPRTDRYIFIIGRTQDEQFHIRELLNALPVQKDIVVIEPHDTGPVQSLVLAKEAVGEDEEVVVNYCDFLMDWDYPGFVSAIRAGGYDGGIASFRGFHPASLGDTYYAYMRVNEKNELMELREKMPFTDNRIEEHASTGTYYFKSWGMMQDTAQTLLRSGSSAPNKEYYPSLLYNVMRDAGRASLVYPVEKFICLGTPKDYEEYRFWQEHFNRSL